MSENLNCNEVRIGNFVNMKSKNRFYIIDRGQDIDECEDFNPIPLTEEWLLKLGFVKNDFDSHYEKDEFHIEVWEKDFVFRWNDFNIDINLNSVHRLQNLYFTLTNEELTLIKRDENNIS